MFEVKNKNTRKTSMTSFWFVIGRFHQDDAGLLLASPRHVSNYVRGVRQFDLATKNIQNGIE